MKPNRTNLSVPGIMEKMHAKAIESKADVIMFDLEDSVPSDQKELARKTIIKTLSNLFGCTRTIAVRINSLDTPYAYKDIIEVVTAAGKIIDAIVLPKVNHEGDIHCISRLLDGIEMDLNLDHTIRIEACIETAKGLERVSQIAKACSRIKSLAFGIADYSASIGAKLTSMSGHGEKEPATYPGHRWHFPVSRMVMAAKANNLLAIDAPFGDFKNLPGLKESAAMAAALGCDGKWVIHPDQIKVVNQAFTPSAEDIGRAKKIIDIFNIQNNPPKSAIAVDGKMIDQATLRLARQLWDQAVYLKLV
ncbi:MAG: CoA ester lyase [Desulfobacteraceae bacterium]|nr:CoA ester lyase [Desulfobacteraceae bacterium]